MKKTLLGSKLSLKLRRGAALSKGKNEIEPKVFIFDIKESAGLSKLESFLKRVGLRAIYDRLESQLEELFLIRNLGIKKGGPDFGLAYATFVKELFSLESPDELWREGRWVYYPWSGNLVHLLPSELFYEIRTNRNRNVLTITEQKSYSGYTAAICGLSVGNSIALTLTLSGGARTLKLADPDELSLSNLNRLRASVADLGVNKSYLAARQILEIDPDAEPIVFPSGLTNRNIDDFLSGRPRPRVVVDALDDLALKLKIRVLAKKQKLPVVMATDCGQGVLLDLERYDLDRGVRPFLGRVDDETLKKIESGELTGDERLLTVAKIVDLKNVSARKTESLLEIGKTLYTWPQLGSSISLCGVAVAFAIQKLALGETNIRGSYLLSLEESFLSYPNHHFSGERGKAAKSFLEKIG